jgi:hypothetical protein
MRLLCFRRLNLILRRPRSGRLRISATICDSGTSSRTASCPGT